MLCLEASRASNEMYEMSRPDVDLRSLDDALERAVIGPLGKPSSWMLCGLNSIHCGCFECLGVSSTSRRNCKALRVTRQ